MSQTPRPRRMADRSGSPTITSHLRPGDRVRVRSEAEILSMLDARGETGRMPYMPEMLEHSGREFTVAKRADKTCDTVMAGRLREMHDTVHLGDLRCDGSAHGGCQTGCLFFWREEWLVRESGDPAESPGERLPPAMGGATVETLQRATTNGTTEDGSTRWSCQATRVPAASRELSVFDLRQYVRDVNSGNATAREVIPGLLISLFNKYQDLSRRLPRWLRFRNGSRYPFIQGTLDRTPSERLDLQPGELVEIKSREEIEATLDRRNNNRGMSFDVEMLKYCGRRARVQKRVERIIDETTGRMLHLANECIILEGVVCVGDFHRFCPRGMYPFWREIWLRRVDQ